MSLLPSSDVFIKNLIELWLGLLYCYVLILVIDFWKVPMTLFYYWLKRYLYNVLTYGCGLFLLFLMITITRFIDDWFLISDSVVQFLVLMICFAPLACKIVLPLAASLACIHTKRDLIDCDEWRGMLVLGLSFRRYVGWSLMVIVIMLSIMSFFGLINESGIIKKQISHIASVAMEEGSSLSVKPGDMKILKKKGVLIYRDKRHPKKYILLQSSGGMLPSSHRVLFASSARQNDDDLPSRFLKGTIFTAQIPKGDLFVATFKQMNGFIPQLPTKNVMKMFNKLFNNIIYGGLIHSLIFLLIIMLWAMVCPFVTADFGRFKSSLFIVFIYCFYMFFAKICSKFGLEMHSPLVATMGYSGFMNCLFFGSWLVYCLMCHRRIWK